MKRFLSVFLTVMLVAMNLSGCAYSTDSSQGSRLDNSDNVQSDMVSENNSIEETDENISQEKNTSAPLRGVVEYGNHVLAVKDDGTVYITTEDVFSTCNYNCVQTVSEWTDIVAVSMSEYSNYGHHIVGLKADGTVVATGDNSSGQCTVEDWTGIVDIYAGDGFTIGIKADGVVTTLKGSGEYDNWRDMEMLASDSDRIYGLRHDGTVLYRDGNTLYTDIKSFDVYDGFLALVRNDGTVFVSDTSETRWWLQETTSYEDWTDMVDVVCAYQNILGIKDDGTIVAARDYHDYENQGTAESYDEKGYNEYMDWENIIAVIPAGQMQYIGLKADGTLVTCGFYDRPQELREQLEGWTNIRTVKAQLEISETDTKDAEQVSVVTQGTLKGRDIDWIFDSEGVLTLIGTGSLGFTMSSEVPWEAIGEYIETVEIGEGITGISSPAFDYLENLTEVVIPSSVTSIRPETFLGCQKLEKFTVSEDNEYYCDVDGVLFSKDKTELVQYTNGKSGESYEIPSGTRIIGESSFRDCMNLKEVIIPDGLEKIGEDSFAGCKFTELIIPGTVTNIGSDGFGSCQDLEKITFEGDAPQMMRDSFYHVKAVAYYPEENATWTGEIKKEANRDGYLEWVAY